MFKRSFKRTAELSRERTLYLKKRRTYLSLVNILRVFIIIALFGLWELAGRMGSVSYTHLTLPTRGEV